MEQFEYYAKASKFTKALWLEMSKLPASEHIRYHGIRYWTFAGDLDITRLQNALQVAVNNNWDKRSNFFEQNGELYLGVRRVVPVKLEYQEVASAQECSKYIEKMAAMPFDFENDPLFRFAAIKNSIAQKTTLVFVFCHLNTDGAVTENLARQVEQAYVDNVKPDAEGNDSAGLEVLKAYMAAQSEEVADDTGVAYWVSRLSGRTIFNQLPRESGSRKQDFKVIEASRMIEGEAYKKIKAFCETNKVSLFNFMQALTGIVVCRYSGAQEAVIVYPVNLRGAYKTLKGFCVNELPYVFEEKGTFLEQVQKLREEIPPRSARKVAAWELTDTVYGKGAHINVALTNSLANKFDFARIGAVLENIWVPNVMQCDLVVSYAELADGIELTVLSVAGVLSNELLEQIADHFVWLAEKHQLLRQGESIATDEHIKTLEHFNQTYKEYPNSCGSIVAMFRQQAQKTPDNIAVVYGERKYTYQELDNITDKLAKHLKTLGIGAEQVVGVLIDRSEYMVIYPLAVLKAGGAYMPLDYSFPSDRLEFMLKDAGVKLILSEQNKVEEHIPQFDGKIIKTDDIPMLAADNNVVLPVPASQDMFVILYTSGSTGMPKGCILEHHNLVNYCNWYQSYYQVTEKDRSPAYANFGFDAHMLDIYPFITCGASTYIIPSDMRLDFIRLNRYFEDNQISIAFMTTQLGRHFVEQLENNSLRTLMVGGEKLLPIKKPSYDFYNVYGPTECTLFTTSHAIQKDYDSSIIGKPLDNYQLYVLDAHLQLVPPGVAGELCVGGAGVGRGYLNRDDVTAEKFIQWKGKRIYRTGDLVRWMLDGEIEYIGRMDGQVKLRGLRIELGEIEAQILSYEAITNCAVAVKEIGGTEHLCAYYTAETEVDLEKLKQQLAAKLTAFMIPATFTRLEAIPLTSNGKVNRKALPEPVIERQETVPPQTETQQQLFDIVAGILATQDFGITDDFFSIGLTSILAIKLSVDIYKQFGVNIKTSDIFKNKTIEQLEQIIKNTIREEETMSFVKQAYYPLTENQLGLYYEWEKDRTAIQYNIPQVSRFSNQVEPSKLKAAVEKAIEAHPYLKTCLATKGGQVVQLRRDNEPVYIELVEVSEADITNIKESFVKPFDLFNAPLYRIAVYYTDQHTYLFLDIHHIIIDGSAVGVFMDDVAKAFKGEVLIPETYTAFEYALEEAQLAESESYKEAARFFDTKLTGGLTELPPVAKGAGKNRINSIVVPVSGTDINNFCHKHAVTPNSLFLAALCTILSRYTREERIAITAISSGRNENKLHDIMGMLVKTVPVVVEVKEQENTADFVKSVQDNLFETLTHEMYPFTKLAEKHGIVPKISYAYQGGFVRSVELAGEMAEIEALALNKARFPMTIVIWSRKADYEIQIEYDESLYTSEYIETLGRVIAHCAHNMTEKAEKSLAAIVIIPAADKAKLLRQSQSRVLDYDKNATFIDLFRKQAQLKAGHIALVDAVSTLSYELTDLYSDCLARELVRLGVTKSTFIGIMLPRRKEYMISVIAAMKAGGAYVPLDNEYPQERIEYMLQDSRAAVLITTKAIYEQKGVQVDNIILIDDFDFGAEQNRDIRLTAPEREHVAYMIYTSGSTGKPKGVMIRHKSLAALLAWRSKELQLTANDHLCCHSSFSFDASVDDLFTPLIVGGQTHIISEEMRQNMYELNQYFHKHNITGGTFSTQFGMELINQFDLPLRFVLMGGEKLKAVKKTNVMMINGYGPTEFTVCSSYHVVDQNSETDNIPIGKPVPNSWAYVVDKNINLLPIGVAGELCMAGEQVALGYWNREDLTAEKFVDNPFKTCSENAKMYRTGDLVRWNAGGELEYAGRIDNQIKLRGFRIELGEVESAIARFPGITASVADIKTIGVVQHLCGYFTADSDIDISQLLEHLRQGLTEYMVPTALVQLDKIPLTPNGKVDKKALPVPELQNLNEYVAPTNEIEAKLCQIFAETLQLEQVGITDSFFGLGGTSLLVMKVVVKAMAMKIGITYGNVFTYQTPQKLAEFVSSSVKEASIIDTGAYDYSAIDQLLVKNSLGEIIEKPLGDILLTGATGFLGIHVLREFLDNYPGKVYCLMRSQDSNSADIRLKVRLVYYFDHDYAELFGSRLFTLEGDITEPETITVKVDTVINCAAMVKHFAVGDELAKVNVDGVRNLIQYCRDQDATLIQVSTSSVAGVADAAMKDVKLKESQLYIGQIIDNIYVHSKFLAERYVLEAAAKGLKAKIMRVGNLMARSQDGEFQLNFHGNSFMNSLKSYKLLGKFPISRMGGEAEFSPIDSTAKAVLQLAQSSNEYTVFHPYNNHVIYMADVIYAMKEYGFPIEIVSDQEFEQCLREKMQDETIMSALTGILAYQENDTEKPVYVLGSSNQFTTEVLYRLNFVWPVTSEFYIKKAIEALDTLGFFDVQFKPE